MWRHSNLSSEGVVDELADDHYRRLGTVLLVEHVSPTQVPKRRRELNYVRYSLCCPMRHRASRCFAELAVDLPLYFMRVILQRPSHASAAARRQFLGATIQVCNIISKALRCRPFRARRANLSTSTVISRVCDVFESTAKLLSSFLFRDNLRHLPGPLE
jgi:hypothetical protein